MIDVDVTINSEFVGEIFFDEENPPKELLVLVQKGYDSTIERIRYRLNDSRLSKETQGLLLDWLKNDLDEAKQDDPSVGICLNEDLVQAFQWLIGFVEDL